MLFQWIAMLGLAASVVSAHDRNGAVDFKNEHEIECGNNSAGYCCNQVTSPDAEATGILAGILNNAHIGVDCTPIGVNILAFTGTTQCETSLICCDGESMQKGAVQLGCAASSHRNMRRSKSEL
ncbi:hypothetical protein CXG81DRAFT_18129 [Caulochytrium protostelioides]|uniref:Hydrophobin n=1 Tax=Caulochytrium protostelioides TaxID=1555241 RepID=A0A4P9X9W5_9FUNG|nr:hypothetical protein CXG81DRAFT_18129 [Caulochytrium protostelioides]|eukprot:RKP02157.1 hypothetical protein CXG81DRAFT_18129 [Caulochytrium protostelioides]